MDKKIKRRDFVNTSLLLGAGSMVIPYSCLSSSKNKSGSFFTVAQMNGRWWLVTPEGDYTFSIGINHIDPAAIRYDASNGIWEDKYGKVASQGKSRFN